MSDVGSWYKKNSKRQPAPAPISDSIL